MVSIARHQAVRRLMAGALPQQHERRRKGRHLLASPRKRCSAFVSYEKSPPELLFTDANLRVDRGLTDIQSLSSLNETSRRNNLEKGFGKLSIDSHTSEKMYLSVNRIRLSNVLARWIFKFF
jgi:hypothetical protein